MVVASIVNVCQQLVLCDTKSSVYLTIQQNVSLLLAVATIDNICQQESCVALKAVSISVYSRMFLYSLQLQLLIIYVSK